MDILLNWSFYFLVVVFVACGVLSAFFLIVAMCALHKIHSTEELSGQMAIKRWKRYIKTREKIILNSAMPDKCQ